MKRRAQFLCPSLVMILALLAAMATGCAVLEDSNSGSGAGMCSTAARASVTGDSYPNYQQAISSTQFVAQSFVLNSGQSVSSISLKLEAFSSSNPSSLSGTLSVFVVPDASGGATPSQPSCSPPSTCATGAAAAATGSLSLGSIALYQPKFYSVSLSKAVTPTRSTPEAFWVVVTTGLGTSTSNYVAWDGTASLGSSQVQTLVTQTNVYSSSWSGANQNMTFQVCQ